MTAPTKPGYYWAKANAWRVDGPEIVWVERPHPHSTRLYVVCIGVEEYYTLDQFIWGPEVVAPSEDSYGS